MARKALRPAQLAVVQAVERVLDGPALVACSGGADSTALALGAMVAAQRHGLGVRAIVVDHGLQDASAEVAAAVAGRLAGRGIAADVVRVRVEMTGDGVEAAARDARYEALARAARPGELILLGHTMDDQAESVLLGLARGSGTRSLAGMRPRRGPFVRPLLDVRAEIVRQACREWDVAWWDDPHNDDERFARVRVRKTVLPVLEQQLGPGIVEALARTAGIARDDADLLDDLAATAMAEASDGDDAPPSLDCARLVALPDALRTRVLRAWLLALGADDVGAVHVHAVDALVVAWRGQAGVDLPGVHVSRRGGRLFGATSA